MLWRRQALAHVFVAEAVKQERALAKHLEELALFGADGLQGSETSAFRRDRLADRVENAVRRFRFSDYGERLQVALISGPPNLHQSDGVGYAFAQAQPTSAGLAVMGRCPIHLEAVWVVDSSFDPQYGKCLIVHFDRVFFDPMFDAQTFVTSEVAGNFTIEIAVDAAAEEAQHISAFTDQHRMLEQAGIELRQRVRVTKHDVGGNFSLAEAPVITFELPFRMTCQGIDFFGQRVEQAGEVTALSLIHEQLRPLEIGDLGECVINLRK